MARQRTYVLYLSKVWKELYTSLFYLIKYLYWDYDFRSQIFFKYTGFWKKYYWRQ